MVARLFRLRIALLGGAFRGVGPVAIRSLLFGLIAVLAAVAIAWLPHFIVQDEPALAAVDTVVVALVLLAALLVPFFWHRRRIEPRQFAQYPHTPAGVATSLLLTAPVSWPSLWLLVWVAAVVAFRQEWQSVSWAVAVFAVLILALGVLSANVAAALSSLLVPPRVEPVLRWFGAFCLVAVLPVLVFFMAETFRNPASSMTNDAARVFGWTPFGAPAEAVALAVAGDVQGAISRFLISAAAIVLLLIIWYLVVARSLRSVPRPGTPLVTHEGLDVFDRLPATPTGVISARALTYWNRDARYRVALIAIPVAPIVMLVALWVVNAPTVALALVPLPVILLLLGWSIHNDIAFDSTAIWLHVASGTSGRADRTGRLAPVLLIGLPLVAIGSSLSVTFAGDWRLLPAVLGMNFTVLLASAGSSSVFSALMPYPTTRPGDNPFAQPTVSGSGAGLAQTLSMFTSLVLSAPVVVLSIIAIVNPTLSLNMGALLLGVVWGLIVLTVCVRVGGYVFNRKAPELVAITQTFD